MRFVFALTILLCPIVTAAARADCPPPITPQRDIIADSYYDDPPVNSHIDPVRKEAYEKAVQPFEDYLRFVAKAASKGDGQCAIQWLVSWAEADAMLGKIENHQAHFERKWVLAGLSLSYAKIRDAASRDQRAAIDNWLQAIAEGVKAYANAHPNSRNNHYYWEGLAVAAAGLVTGNQADIAWGREVYRFAMNQIGDDGSLPLELARGSRALHYHLFAAEPLAMLGSILGETSPKFDALVQFCLAGLKDSAPLSKRVGVTQLVPSGGSMDWLAIYSRQHPTVDTNAVLAERKPYVYRLGGDLTKANPLEHVTAH